VNDLSRSKSKIEFYEGVPISTDFKHEPLFDSKADQVRFFNKYKKSSLTFEGSYQRVEEQIKTAFKYEQLVNINYVHVINPSFEGAPEEESEWWGFVIDIHYINDGLVTVDWVVDPVQTFMFRWDLNKAFIERGMLDIVKQDENKYRYLDNQNAAILSNDEAIGVDGLAHYLFHDNVMKAHSNYESDIVFLILLIGDSENKSFVGIPSQIEYYVLPYDRKRGRLINFEISDVRGGQGYTTIKSESNGDWSVLYALDQISKDMDLTKGGKAILGGYIQNHIGLDFEVDATEGTTDVKITAAMARSEWEPPLGSRSNLEIYKAGESGGEDSGGGGDNGGGDNGGDNGGGGSDSGWNGEYPPSVTTQAERYAWQAWANLKAKGYSDAAIAGILGNIRGEVGPTMNPDTEQVQGPGYGAVQWDGSAYPLVGSPTWNGREYVQRLMNAAGITKDYKTMDAQMDLVDWCMYNGQWIGQVDPRTVSGFKAATSPETAARAFELNFERPAASHPERQGWAREWYDKFKGL